jgi:hypothetical protein
MRRESAIELIDRFRGFAALQSQQDLESGRITAKPLGLEPKSVRLRPSSGPVVRIGSGVANVGNDDYRPILFVSRRWMESATAIRRIKEECEGEIIVRRTRVARPLIGPSHCQARHRPLRIGTSVAHHLNSAGTISCFVRLKGDETGSLRLLSNNHVLVRDNKMSSLDCTVQPGKADRGIRERDRIGKLESFEPLILDGSNRFSNQLDCALSVLNGDDVLATLDPGLLMDGTRVGTAQPDIQDLSQASGFPLKKIGRTTGPTLGRIVVSGATVPVRYDFGVCGFDDLLLVESSPGSPRFSEGGDSGSLVTDRDNNPVGIVFAGMDSDPFYTYVIPIERIFEKMKITPVFG